MKDIFRPKSEPALTLYKAFQAEAKFRNERSFEQWSQAEIEAVWRAARDYAQANNIRVPTVEEVAECERYALGSIDYGAKWAFQVARLLSKMPMIKTV